MVTHFFLVNDDLLYSLILSEIIHSLTKKEGKIPECCIEISRLQNVKFF